MKIQTKWSAVVLGAAFAIVGTMPAVPALAANHGHSDHNHQRSDHNHGKDKGKGQDRLKVTRSMGHVTAPQAKVLSTLMLPTGTASSIFGKGAAYTVYTVRLVGPHAHFSGKGSVVVSDNDSTLTTPADLYYLGFSRGGKKRPDPFTGMSLYNGTVGQNASFTVKFVRGQAQFAVFNGQKGSGPVTITVTDGKLTKSVVYPDRQTSLATGAAASITSSVTGATAVTAGTPETITFTVTDSTGQPVSGATVTFGVAPLGTLNSTDLSPTAGTTNSSGQVTVTYTDTTAGDSGTVTATSGSATGATGTLTVVPAALAKYAISGFTPGTTGTVTVTAEDQYGNIVTSITSGYATFTSVNGDVSTDSTPTDAFASMIQSNGTPGTNIVATPTPITFTNGVATLSYVKATNPVNNDSPEFIDTLTVQNTSSSPTITQTAGGGTVAQY